MTYKPHDAIFKAIFEHVEHAIALFRNALPIAIANTLAWPTLLRESSSYVDTHLADRHGDLLFRIETHEGEPRYLLLEHQSSPDPDMPLRVYVYHGEIWQRFRKQHGGRIPPIIPVVVSHAPGGWTGPTTFAELLAMRSDDIDLAPFVPDSTMVVEDLARLSNEDLDARPLSAIPKLTLWLLRDARSGPRFRENLPFWARYFGMALREPRGAQSVDLLLNYVALVCEQFSWNDFLATIHEQAPEAEDTIMTIAEELIAKGIEQGIERGRERGIHEGRAELLSKLFELKFGPAASGYQPRLATASRAELDLWAERVLFCASLDDVFAPSH